MASALAFQSMMTSPRAAVANSAMAPLIQIARENLDVGIIETLLEPSKSGLAGKLPHPRRGGREEAVKLW
jgi:hypothetical protein